MLLIYMHRCYMFCATDALRLRLSSAMGYLRLQIEAAALMDIIRRSPVVGQEWVSIRDDSSGRRFHQKHAKVIAEFRRDYNLEFEWNIASATTQHVRLHSIVFGLNYRTYTEPTQEVSEIWISFQEADPSRPQDMILRFLSILRTQERLLNAIPRVTPEVDDPILLDIRLPKYTRKIDGLWTRFADRFPSDAQHWTAIGRTQSN